jgi:hypothetical protein
MANLWKTPIDERHGWVLEKKQLHPEKKTRTVFNMQFLFQLVPELLVSWGYTGDLIWYFTLNIKTNW